MTTPSKVLFIGVDAGDKDLILEWAQAGLLPAFRSLLDRNAAWGTTIGPPGLFVGALWPSFITSLSPERHGRYCFKQLKPGSYQTPQFLPAHTRGTPFWVSLSQAGKKIAVIDVPKSSLSRDLNGVQVVDWATHDPDEGFRTQPAGLAATVEKKYGLDPVGVCDGQRSSAEDYLSLKNKLLKRLEMKTAFCRTLLAEQDWDCFMTVFAESHCAGHQCWHLLDRRHPLHDAELARRTGNPILEIYQAIDSSLAALLREAGPQTHVFVLASHGMGPHYRGTHMLESILTRLEAPSAAPKPGWKDTARKIWRWIPKDIRKHFFKELKKKINQDASGRTYFQIPNNDVYGGIRINLIGREPGGRVHPGAEAESVKEALIRDLLQLVDTQTREPAVLKVHRIEDLYPGRETGLFPDLLVEWNYLRPISSVWSAKTGRIDSAYHGCRTGDHKNSGLFFVTGPSVRPGPIQTAVSIMDFGPTISSLLGVALSDVDGRSFLEKIH